jgi:hypothetical protein
LSAASVSFSEPDAQQKVARVPMAHLSIELGHFYMEDFAHPQDDLVEHFRRVKPWADLARQELAANATGQTPRVSTCFMIDDYFARDPGIKPHEAVDRLCSAASDAAVSLDYIGRESGCARAGTADLAALVEARLVPDPMPGANGFRPEVKQTHWLCNGERAPQSAEALREEPWTPSVEAGARNHSIFLDVELHGQGKWSCSFLAAIWQLFRLGLLRDNGRPVVTPERWSPDLPNSWDEIPPVVRVNPDATFFTAYRTLSILSSEFLPIESAVRMILGRVDVTGEVRRQLRERSKADCNDLPADAVARLGYVFLPG